MEKIKETFIRRNRFFVRTTDNGTLPRANYVWLKSNPSFKEIPRGYVVHHLDNDQTNDDPSNLVIMYKHHHVAYHLKQKTEEVRINIIADELPENYILKKPPSYHKHCNTYYISIPNNGKNVKFWRDYNDNPITTEEQAKTFSEEIFKRSNTLTIFSDRGRLEDFL